MVHGFQPQDKKVRSLESSCKGPKRIKKETANNNKYTHMYIECSDEPQERVLLIKAPMLPREANNLKALVEDYA